MEIVQARKLAVSAQTSRTKEPGKGRGSVGGIREAARELGVPATNLRQSVKIAKLSPEAKAEARKLKLDDNQDALLEATKAKTPEAQTAVIERRAQQQEPAATADTAGLRTLKAAWNKANTKDRDAFCAWIEE